MVLTARWLQQYGYSRQLIRKYCRSQWIRKIGHGAYAKDQETVTLPGALSALQKQLHLPIHLGGLSALEYQGMAHYIPFQAIEEAQLFNTTSTHHHLPQWFQRAFPHVMYYQLALFHKAIGFETHRFQGVDIMLSTPERAILELLAQVPHLFDFEQGDALMAHLQLLRPYLVNALLQTCTSIKVKRLFVYLADKHQLACFDHLRWNDMDLGRGKRVIGQGGHYVARYYLSVPKQSTDEEEVLVMAM